jgi:hypothetical protein
VRRSLFILLLATLLAASVARAQDSAGAPATTPSAAATTTTDTTPTDTAPASTTPAAEPPTETTPAPVPAKPHAPTLSLSIASAPSFGDLAPGNTSTVTEPLVVSAESVGWSLHVGPADPGADRPGHLRAADSPSCAHGERWLRSPLHLHTSGAGPGTTIDLPDYDLGSSADPQIAHGSADDALSVTYRQRIADDEPLEAGCSYSVGVIWTVVAG